MRGRKSDDVLARTYAKQVVDVPYLLRVGPAHAARYGREHSVQVITRAGRTAMFSGETTGSSFFGGAATCRCTWMSKFSNSRIRHFANSAFRHFGNSGISGSRHFGNSQFGISGSRHFGNSRRASPRSGRNISSPGREPGVRVSKDPESRRDGTAVIPIKRNRGWPPLFFGETARQLNQPASDTGS
jgi:hypothetical protein